jgi:hypothetical protein
MLSVRQPKRAIAMPVFPRWLRPPLARAALLVCIVLFRAVVALPRLLRSEVEWADFLRALAGAAALGALSGLAYSLIGRPLRRVRKAGPYLAGIVTFAAYIFPLMFWGHIIFGGEPLADPQDPFLLPFLSVLTLIVGPIMGHRWFKDDAGPV